MKNKARKRVTSMVVAMLILSNSIFIYADEKKLIDHHGIADLTVNENDHCKPKIRLNLINNRQFVLYDNKNEFTIDDTENTDDNDKDADTTLSLLNMNYNEYKNELKKGESLQTLLEKNEVTKKYNEYKYNEYKEILKNAVKNKAITQEEMDKLVKDYNSYIV